MTATKAIKVLEAWIAARAPPVAVGLRLVADGATVPVPVVPVAPVAATTAVVGIVLIMVVGSVPPVEITAPLVVTLNEPDWARIPGELLVADGTE